VWPPEAKLAPSRPVFVTLNGQCQPGPEGTEIQPIALLEGK